jgi:coenzyme F420-reducing hydrogenase gamma subunit
MQEILGKKFKAFWMSNWGGDDWAFSKWFEITLKDGSVIDTDTLIEVPDMSDDAIVINFVGEACVNGNIVKLSTLYNEWNATQTHRKFLLEVDTDDAEALIKLIVDSGLKVSVNVI